MRASCVYAFALESEVVYLRESEGDGLLFSGRLLLCEQERGVEDEGGLVQSAEGERECMEWQETEAGERRATTVKRLQRSTGEEKSPAMRERWGMGRRKGDSRLGAVRCYAKLNSGVALHFFVSSSIFFPMIPHSFFYL